MRGMLYVKIIVAVVCCCMFSFVWPWTLQLLGKIRVPS